MDDLEKVVETVVDEGMLLAVPNVSEGRRREVIDAISSALTSGGARLLDLHSDRDHNRSVYTLAGEPEQLVQGLVNGGREAAAAIDMKEYVGVHPSIGALDVAPIVYTDSDGEEVAADSARRLADKLAADVGLPVFLYGGLASSAERSERSYFRNGGINDLIRRMDEKELRADVGPESAHPTAGAVLVTARQPLVAFNLELENKDLSVASKIAELIRERSSGLSGVRAIGVYLPERERAQISMNVERPDLTPLWKLVEAVREHAHRLDTKVACAEVVGVVPQAALEQFPSDLEIRDFAADGQVLERLFTAK